MLTNNTCPNANKHIKRNMPPLVPKKNYEGNWTQKAVYIQNFRFQLLEFTNVFFNTSLTTPFLLLFCPNHKYCNKV